MPGMGQRSSLAVPAASRANVVDNAARLSRSNDDATLASFTREEAQLRSDQELDDRTAAMRSHARIHRHEVARRRASMAAHRLGVPLPPVPLYRTQHEWNAELAARTATIENQASRIEELEGVLANQKLQLQRAAAFQQAVHDDLETRRAENELEGTAHWKGMYVELLRWKAEHQDRVERVEREAAHFREQSDVVQRKYDVLKEDIRTHACDKCYPRLKAIHRRSYADDVDASASRRAHGFV